MRLLGDKERDEKMKRDVREDKLLCHIMFGVCV